MKIAKARTLCLEWQKRLGLTEWFVAVKWGKLPEGEAANIEWNHGRLTAEMTLRRGEGEHTVVHELLHLRLEGHSEPHPENLDYERAINVLATVLIGKPDL